jgi:predicted membrane protein
MNLSSHDRTFGLGLLVITIGVVIFLNQFDVFPPRLADVLISWQMLLIAIGIYNLLYTQSRLFGVLLIVVGGFFILPEIFFISLDFRKVFWPVILILIGLFILFKSGVFGKSNLPKPVEAGDMEYIDEVNIFSGSEKRIAIKNFRGGKITSIFGGSEIDLSGSDLADGTNIIEVFYLFGGSTIKVPNSWAVTNKVTAILGGFSDKRDTVVETTPEFKKNLTIRGFVMFGGGEIKS